ncbi:MAG: sugar transferase [Muribaculum sp.]|nr:sugar transferase [Muribaculum sp.]
MKRLFDIVASAAGLIILSPVFVVLAVWIKIDSRGPVFYLQSRVGKDNKDFKLYKFRSMRPDSDKDRLITVGERDPRITNSGYFIRRYKLDEFPQLINVLKGEMSLVGPRPEVRRYVDMYTPAQMRVLSVRPGITSRASLLYRKENEILAASDDPERTYVEEVMPHKLSLDLEYIDGNPGLWGDIRLIFGTIAGVAVG